MKKFLLALACICTLAGCNREADVASQNISHAADDFMVNRRIDPSTVSTYHYDVVFNPATIIPSVHVK